MNCGQATEALGAAPWRLYDELPVELQLHLNQCESCRKLWEFVRNSGSAAVDSEVEKKITDQMVETLTPVRPIPGRGFLALGFLTIFGLVSAVMVGYVGVQGAAAMTTLQLAGVLSAILIAAVLVAIGLSGEMAPGDRRLIPPAAQSGLLLLLVLLSGALIFPWETSDGWLAGSWRCFAEGFVFSAPAAVLAVTLLGRGVVLSWPVVGAGAGLLAGLVGATVLHFGCTMHSAPHITVGHLSLPVVGALLGAALGRLLPRLTKPRTTSSALTDGS